MHGQLEAEGFRVTELMPDGFIAVQDAEARTAVFVGYRKPT